MLNKNVLITGASGFLGGIIIKNLSTMGYSVFAGTRDPSFLKKLENYNCAQFRKIDLDDPLTFAEALKEIDIIVHLAALNFQDCEKNPDKAIRVNIENVRKLCEVSKSSSVKHFIYMSSIHTYGSPLEGVLREENPTFPNNLYSKSHRDAENIILEYFHEGLFNATIFRLSNAFGIPAHPNVNVWNLIAFDLCKQIALSQSIKLNSSGIQLRNFIVAKDVARAIAHFIEKNEHLGCPVYNLGSATTTSILEFANIAKEVAEKKLQIKIPISTKDSPTNSYLFEFNTDKISETGFECQSDIKEELEALLDYCIIHKELL